MARLAGRACRLIGALSLALVAAGCDLVEHRDPAPHRAKETPTAGAGPSEESRRLAAYYAAREARLVAQGKLREDFDPADAPFTVDDLVRDFRRVALYDEYRPDAPGLVAEETLSQLRRWHKPLFIDIEFGASVPTEQRRADLAEVQSFARRLGALTRLPVHFTDRDNANFLVLFLNADEMKTVPGQLARDLPWVTPEIVRGIATLPRDVYCVAYGLTSDRPPFGYVGAVVVIRAEHPPRLRKSCIQEEMTQALGLANDADDIRPSIFNDDEEFAYLTRHDELLLKMLYDPRLRDGMTPESQAPILRQVAEDAMKRSQI